MPDAVDDLNNILDWYISANDLLTSIQKAFNKDPDRVSSHLLWPREGEPVDKALRHLEKTKDELKDYTVLALFSVFEGWLQEDFSTQRNELVEPRGMKIDDQLDVYKTLIGADVVGQVKQIKEYRNWIAHGRRRTPSINAHPKMAYERLSKFICQVRGR
ncbi:MAG: hypothetical protein N2320_06570 [Candidatus Bipolaricaulota bacterium]|nr:hypothetical protein [Candidatus Bipolaricaulota bacterium]